VDSIYPRPPVRHLTSGQGASFARDGYLFVPGALTPAEVARLTDEVDRLYERDVLGSADPDPTRRLDALGCVGESDAFIELVDHPTTFNLVLDLLGPWIQLGLTTVTYHPPNPTYQGFLHVDGGPSMQRIRVSETSWPLQVKIIWFLTDTSEPDMGNIVVVPGSHLRSFPEEGGINEFGEPPAETTPGTYQLCAAAGDALIFTHALWHGGVRNLSDKPRKNLQYGYNQAFFRSFDFLATPPELLPRCTPRQRRLLGDHGPAGQPKHHFYPDRDHARLMYGEP